MDACVDVIKRHSTNTKCQKRKGCLSKTNIRTGNKSDSYDRSHCINIVRWRQEAVAAHTYNPGR